MSVTLVKTMSRSRSVPKAVRSPERQALAQAIAKRDERAGEVKRISDAVHAAEKHRFSTFLALDDARASLAKSRSEAAINAAARYLGEAPLSDLRVPEGRREVERLESELEDAKVLLAALEQRLHDAKSTLGYREMDVERCLSEVVQGDPAVEWAVSDFVKAAQGFRDAAATVGMLSRKGMLSKSLESTYRWTLQENDSEPAGAWVTALAELSRDADVELPG
jgi:hypothetical protein